MLRKLAVAGGLAALALAGTPATAAQAASESNLALNRPVVGTTSCSVDQGPEKAVDGSWTGGPSDKWCSAVAGVKTLEIDLGASRRVVSFMVRHAGAGGEDPALNTRDFEIQVAGDSPWEGVIPRVWSTVAVVKGNTASVNEINARIVASGRYVRFTTTDPVVRLYDIQVYSSSI